MKEKCVHHVATPPSAPSVGIIVIFIRRVVAGGTALVEYARKFIHMRARFRRRLKHLQATRWSVESSREYLSKE